MSFAVLGMGTSVPGNRIPQVDAAEAAKHICCETEDQGHLLPTLYRQTGIQFRHMVLKHSAVKAVVDGSATEESNFLPKDKDDHSGPSTDERMTRYAKEAPELAYEAASFALTEADLSPREITHVVTVSCTGFGAPGVDIALFKKLGLPQTAQRVNVGFMGCHGALNGLRVARGLAGADQDARVLLCAVELCSLHFHYGWDPKKIVANALFADGSAAMVGAPASEFHDASWRLKDTASCLIPDSEFAMSWNIGNHGYEMTLSTRVPTLISENVRPFMDKWLAKHGMTVADVKSWAIHPGGPRILSSVEKPLGIDESMTNVSREILQTHGNMSSPTVLFILKKLREQNAPRPCVALGFGPGLMAEAALFV